MKPLILILSVIFIGLFTSCKTAQNTNATSEGILNQGEVGKVLWREGDFMPGPNSKNRSVGAAREIFIHEVTNINQVIKDGHFYKDIGSDLIKKINSDVNGNFQVSLAPGTYSIFTKEDMGYFANILDDENNIFPITVDSAKITKVSIVIDYKAAY